MFDTICKMDKPYLIQNKSIVCKDFLFWLTILILIQLPTISYSQCSNDPPHADNCEEAPIICSYEQLNGYCFTMIDYPAYNRPPWMCPGTIGDWSNWVSFFAECPTLDLMLTFTNWQGQPPISVRAAVYDYHGLCPDSFQDPDEILFCTGGGCFNSNQNPNMQLEINLTNLVVGNIYYILITNCAGEGDYSDVNFDVLSPSCGGGEIGPWPGDIQGPLVSCTGSTGVYQVEKPSAASSLHWYLDGTLIQEGNIDSVTIEWTTAGTYELCVDASNYCIEESENPDPTCITIVIEDLVPIDPDPVIICHDETFLYDGIAYPPGVHPVQHINPIGCDSSITLTVVGVDTVMEDLGPFYLCEGTSITVHGQTYTSAQTGDHSILTQQALPPNCDSTILFNIAMMNLQAYVAPPDELGCDITEVSLNGAGSVVVGPPGCTVIYQWFAAGGGVLGDPSDEATMVVSHQGEYCLNITITAPDGSTMCEDSACVVVASSGDLPPAPLITGPLKGCIGDTLSYSLLSQGDTPPSAYTWIPPTGANTLLLNDSTLLFVPLLGDTVSLCGFTTDECGPSPQTCLQILVGVTDTLFLASATCDPAQAGVFMDTLSNQAGCDSLVIRTITLMPELRDTLLSQTCDPSQAGVFSDTLSSQQGCDSIVVQLIALLPSHSDTTINSTCDPALAGTDTLWLQNKYGCDSLVITTTNLSPSHQINQTIYTCDPTQAGLDTLYLINQHGCDSTLYIERIYTGNYQETNQTLICGTGVNYADTILIASGPCDSLFITNYQYVPLDTTWLTASTCDPAQTGISSSVLPSSLGCDSTIVITTSLIPPDSTYVTGITCDSAGAVYSVTVMPNQFGCDSVVTLDIQYVGIDTVYLQQTTCDPTQVGSEVTVLPGVDCDTIQVIETTFVPFTQSEETIIMCSQPGVLSDTTTLQNSAGCDSLVIRHYVYESLTAQVDIQGETCADDADGHMEIYDISGGQTPYELQINAGNWQQVTLFDNLSPGPYTIIIRDAAGCRDTLSDLVIAPGVSVAIDAGPDRIAAPGEVIDLSAQANQSLSQVQWTATDPLSCPTCIQTTLGPLSGNQTVVVTGWTVGGCTHSDALEVIVKARGNLFIPNSFSPNADGINDVFSVYGNDQIVGIRNLAVYDRWGNALYARRDLPINDPSAGWDGTFRDKMMDPGVYVYVVEVELIDGSVRLYKGDVMLVK
jgi:gliding motility-associated-like protein